METTVENNKMFENHDFCRYAVDVTFQQYDRPTGNVSESNYYKRGKHKLYGYKTEVCGLPNGMAINCYKHYAGSISDIDIFYKNLSIQNELLENSTK